MQKERQNLAYRPFKSDSQGTGGFAGMAQECQCYVQGIQWISKEGIEG